eukprot:1137696-Pelagomonas_calceolata.AAC.1
MTESCTLSLNMRSNSALLKRGTTAMVSARYRPTATSPACRPSCSARRRILHAHASSKDLVGHHSRLPAMDGSMSVCKRPSVTEVQASGCQH